MNLRRKHLLTLWPYCATILRAKAWSHRSLSCTLLLARDHASRNRLYENDQQGPDDATTITEQFVYYSQVVLFGPFATRTGRATIGSRPALTGGTTGLVGWKAVPTTTWWRPIIAIVRRGRNIHTGRRVVIVRRRGGSSRR